MTSQAVRELPVRQLPEREPPEPELTAPAPRRAAVPNLSIVIVIWNDWPKLRDCLIIYGNPPPGIEIALAGGASLSVTGE